MPSDVPRCGANLKRSHSVRAKGREAIYNTAEERSLSVLARVRLQGTRRPSAFAHLSLSFFLVEKKSFLLGEEIPLIPQRAKKLRFWNAELPIHRFFERQFPEEDFLMCSIRCARNEKREFA